MHSNISAYQYALFKTKSLSWLSKLLGTGESSPKVWVKIALCPQSFWWYQPCGTCPVRSTFVSKFAAIQCTRINVHIRQWNPTTVMFIVHSIPAAYATVSVSTVYCSISNTVISLIIFEWFQSLLSFRLRCLEVPCCDFVCSELICDVQKAPNSIVAGDKPQTLLAGGRGLPALSPRTPSPTPALALPLGPHALVCGASFLCPPQSWTQIDTNYCGAKLGYVMVQ